MRKRLALLLTAMLMVTMVFVGCGKKKKQSLMFRQKLGEK